MYRFSDFWPVLISENGVNFTSVIFIVEDTKYYAYYFCATKKRPAPFNRHPLKNGAGEGNRTLVASLEGWSSTIELHPQVVGAAGFEPATPWSRTKCATKLRYAPMKNIIAKKKSFVTYFFISFSVS